MRKTI